MMDDDFLATRQVMARYHLRDPRAARNLMHEAGALLVAGRLLVKRSDLIAIEVQHRVNRLTEGEIRSTIGNRVRLPAPVTVPAKLDAGWYRD